MGERNMEEAVKNLNVRVERIEQILPTLATKDDLAAAVAPLATREEMHAAIAVAVAPLATREELQSAIGSVREKLLADGEQTRRHFDVVAERLEGHIKLIAEGHGVLAEKIDALGAEMRKADAALDRRVTRLEASR